MFGKCERNVNTTLFISVVERVEQNTLYDTPYAQKNSKFMYHLNLTKKMVDANLENKINNTTEKL